MLASTYRPRHGHLSYNRDPACGRKYGWSRGKQGEAAMETERPGRDMHKGGPRKLSKSKTLVYQAVSSCNVMDGCIAKQ